MKKILEIFTFVLIVSCGNSVEVKKKYEPFVQDQFSVNDLTFENVYNQILKPNCIQCHVGYSNYDIVFSERHNILDAVLTERMPKNSTALEEHLKSLLNAWIIEGAPIGGRIMVQSNPEKLIATWSSIGKKVIVPKCVQCHQPSGIANFLDLSSRQKFFDNRHFLLNNFEDVENSYLVKVVSDLRSPMPPIWSNIERLSKEEEKILIEWIRKGVP